MSHHWAATALPGPPQASLVKESEGNFSKSCSELYHQNSFPSATYQRIFRGHLKQVFLLFFSWIKPSPKASHVHCLALMHQSVFPKHLHLVSKRLPHGVLPSISHFPGNPLGKLARAEAQEACSLEVQGVFFSWYK